MSSQLALFPERASIAERFAAYHAAHPEVYARFVELALEAKADGHRRYSADGIFHVMRWERGKRRIKTRAEGDDYKLNNDFTAHYARLAMRERVELRGFFEVRG